ncbi:MAG: response regulator [Anaerolineales bacterium]|nr:response regulator [Anaerolineales bacterium]
MISKPTIPVPSKKILVVEDDEAIRETIVQHLQIDNFFVVQAGDGEQALKALEHFSPDLILSDINMPRKDGITFFKDVRKHPQWAAIPFLFLTSDNSPTIIRLARELGVEDHLTKPIKHQELTNTINARLLRATEVEVAHIGQAYLETVAVLANAIEGRDNYTRGHVDRVTKIAMWMAQELRWPEDQMRTLEFGARLHDIGKVIVPDHILNKKGKLNEAEWELMKQHPVAGEKILMGISHLHAVRPYVLYHHERWDGCGYPEGLKQREIPLEARLLSIIDVYDALTTERPYHPPRPHEEVLKFLELNAGKHFDPDLVLVFHKVMQMRTQSAH